MKKALSLIIAAVISLSVASSALADEGNAITEADVLNTETNGSQTIDSNVDLLAAIDGITFEYDYSASAELVRVVKVRYDKTYFTTGINSFNAEITIPEQYVASVSYTTRLSGFNDISDSYSNGVYKCSGTSGTNKIPSDGLLFTMRITLKQNILTPFTISLTGDSSLGDDSGITQYLSSGGMNPASLEIPANINDVGDSGTDGAVTWEYANEVLRLHGNGTMTAYRPGGAPWYAYADRIKRIEFTEDNLQNISTNAFYGLYNAETVVLSSDIRTINNNAFEGCSSLKNIDIPTNSGVGIGEYAFKDCSSLTSLYVPDGVRTIGRGAFEGCDKLASVTLPFIGSQKGDSNSKNTFSYIFNDSVPQTLAVVSITNETNVPESAFEGCGKIENIYINDGVTTIGSKAFKGCTALKGFTIPNGVTEIADYTFQNCSQIISIDITDKISSIGIGAFDGCAKLELIYIPPVETISDYTFRGCSSLTQITIPNSVTNIGLGVLSGCTKLVDVKVPFVGANADPGSTSVTNEGIFGYFFGVTDNNRVPAAVTKVEVTGTDRGLYIPKSAFKSCGNIEDIIIDGGRSVLDEAFANCLNLRNLYIPKSISNIGSTILSGCTRLNTLTIPFVGTNREDKNKPTSVLGGFFGYDDQDLGNGTLQYYNENGDSHLYKIPKSLKNVTILNQTTIPVGAFSECDFVENVSIVSGGSMGEKAFYHCASLKTATLPNDLRTIGDEAFAECENLETINIPTKVKTIGSQVFYNARNLKNVTMPDSVTEIAEDVFNGTDLYGGEVELMSSDLTITCSADSTAKAYADAHNIRTNIVPSSELDIKCVGASISSLSTGGYLVDVSDTNSLDGIVYAALYDRNGRLLAAGVQKKTEDDQVEYRFEFTEEESTDYDHAKVFVWGNNQKPLSDGVNNAVGQYTIQ